MTQPNKQRGFTIVELMIATGVLSVILVFVSVVVINIGNLYYKGITQSRIQDLSRNLTEDVAQHLELSDGDFKQDHSAADSDGHVVNAYCMGSTRYVWVQNVKLGSDSNAQPHPTDATHVLWRDTIAPGFCNAPSYADFNNFNPAAAKSTPTTGPGNNGRELMIDNGRVLNFSIDGSSPYTVSIGVAYGDNDLLSNEANPKDHHCNGGAGQHFCATASQETSVAKRLP